MNQPETFALPAGLAGVLLGFFLRFDQRSEQVDQRFELADNRIELLRAERIHEFAALDKKIDDLRADATGRLDRIDRLHERLLKPELSS